MNQQYPDKLTPHQETFLNLVKKGWMPPKTIHPSTLRDMSTEAKDILVSKGVDFSEKAIVQPAAPIRSVSQQLDCLLN